MNSALNLGLNQIAPGLTNIVKAAVFLGGTYSVIRTFTNGQKIGNAYDLLKGVIDLDQEQFYADGGTESGTAMGTVGNGINSLASSLYLYASKQPYGAHLKKFMPLFIGYQAAMLGSEILFPDGDGAKDNLDIAANAINIACGIKALGGGTGISTISHGLTLLKKRSGLVKQLAQKWLDGNTVHRLTNKLHNTDKALDELAGPAVSYLKPVADSVKRVWSKSDSISVTNYSKPLVEVATKTFSRTRDLSSVA